MKGHQHTFRKGQLQRLRDLPVRGGERNYFFLAWGVKTCNLRILPFTLND